MNPIIARLIKAIRDNPSAAVATLTVVLPLLRLDPGLIADALPPGPLKDYATKNPEVLLSLVEVLVKFFQAYPDLLTALLAQYTVKPA